MNFRQFIEDIPKTELHLHLDGAFTIEFLYSLVKKYKSKSNISSINELRQKFRYTDFQHFIRTWFWKNNLYREPIDFENSVFYSLKNLSEQNIVYLEAYISPWDYQQTGLKPKDIINSAINGVNKASEQFDIKCRLIIDITRDHGHVDAIARLNEITEYLGDTVIGIGLGGSEQDYPAYLFKEVFLEAKKRGFHVVAHAGEVAGPRSIWSAINDLQAERIGHGVRAIEDPKLVEYLATNRVPLEVCVNSNIKTGVYKKYNDHPIKELFDSGIITTINSDDPAMFETTLTEEYLVIENQIKMPIDKIIRLMNNSIDASFATIDEKIKLKKGLNGYWIQNFEKLI